MLLCQSEWKKNISSVLSVNVQISVSCVLEISKKKTVFLELGGVGGEQVWGCSWPQAVANYHYHLKCNNALSNHFTPELVPIDE